MRSSDRSSLGEPVSLGETGRPWAEIEPIAGRAPRARHVFDLPRSLRPAHPRVNRR